MHLFREKVSMKKDLDLMKAAQKLSYPSLAFLRGFGSPPTMDARRIL